MLKKGAKSLELPFVALLLATSAAVISTIWSLYINSFVNNMPLVGIIDGFLTIIMIFSLLFLTPVIERYPESKIFMFCIFWTLISYILLYFTNSFFVFLVVAALLMITKALRVESFGILIRDSTRISKIGKTEGLKYSFSNIGWVIGPLLGGLIAAKFGIKPIFLVSALFLIFVLFILIKFKIKDTNHYTKNPATLRGSLKNVKDFFSNKKFIKIYSIAGGMSFYWSILYIYLPLFIVDKGLPVSWVGLFLFGISLPLIFLEYPVGKIADKTGFKIFFVLGYGILALFSLIAFFAQSIYSLILILVIGSIGAAFLEGNRESHFFKTIKKSEEEKFYGPYMTTTAVFYSLGGFVGAAVISILPRNYIFLMLSLAMLAAFLVSLTVKEK